MTTLPVPTLTVRFENIPLRPDDIRLLRGEAIAQLPQNDHLHNHTPTGQSQYRYPLVQYRVEQGRATLFGIGQGVEAVQALLDTLGDAPYLAISALTNVGLTDELLCYTIRQWWPLNSENLQQWEQANSLTIRLQLLERILTNQLLALCKDIGYRVPNRGLRVQIQELQETASRRFHTQQATQPIQARLFEVVYTTNLRLPDGVGVGKGVSKGFGVQRLAVAGEPTPRKRPPRPRLHRPPQQTPPPYET